MRTSCSGPLDTVSTPGRVMSASMPSAAQKLSMSRRVCRMARWVALARVTPTLRSRSCTLRPTMVMANPPLRPLAP